MIIQTYKIKHKQDFNEELEKAKKVAEYGIKHRSQSSADVKHIGLKSMISNQILRKYSRNKKAKGAHSVKLTIPNQGIKLKDNKIYIPCLKLYLPIYFSDNFVKINQIEIGRTYAYISVSYETPGTYKEKTVMGVDRNTKSHVIVASNIDTGKVLKLGKSCNHIHNKYKNMRKQLQKKGKYKKLKKVKRREQNKIKNINHHISKKLVEEAYDNKAVIVLEDLNGIRDAQSHKKQRYSLNSWSFYQLKQMIEYKSKKLGVPIKYVNPKYTSQRCSHCGHIEQANRKGKLFQCKKCGIVENADANSGFNIAYLYQEGISQFVKDRDLAKGSTDTPKEAMV